MEINVTELNNSALKSSTELRGIVTSHSVLYVQKIVMSQEEKEEGQESQSVSYQSRTWLAYVSRNHANGRELFGNIFFFFLFEPAVLQLHVYLSQPLTGSIAPPELLGHEQQTHRCAAAAPTSDPVLRAEKIILWYHRRCPLGEFME